MPDALRAERLALAAWCILGGLLCATASGQNVRILCFGDSITAGVNLDHPDAPLRTTESGYLPALARYLNARWDTVALTNEGVPGLTAFDATQVFGSVLSQGQYNYVLIHIGTNDLNRVLGNKTSVGEIAANIEYLVGVANSRPNLTTILSTVLPRIPGTLGDALVMELNARIKGIASAHGVRLADQNAHFHIHGDLDLYSDLLHPNISGYEVMAEEWASVITGTLRNSIDLLAPIFETITPWPGQTDVSPLPEILVTTREVGSTLDTGSLTMEVNGESVQPAITQNADRYTMSYVPASVFPFLQTVSVRLQASDTADPVNTAIRSYVFKISTGNGRSGDVNNNGQVDGVDLILLGSAFGSVKGDSSYLQNADFDQSLTVDGVDLAVLARSFSM